MRFTILGFLSLVDLLAPTCAADSKHSLVLYSLYPTVNPSICETKERVGM